MRAWVCVFLLAAPGLFGAATAEESPRRSRAASCERSTSEDSVASLSPAGEIGLRSGRKVRLLDVRLPADGEDLERSLAWLRTLVGRRVSVAALSGGADRWGRHAADVALVDEPAPIDLAERLVAEGFVFVDATERAALCRPELLAAEDRARGRRAGLWASERHRPISAQDMTRLTAQIGHYALVEGVVRSVGERPQRVYLNFGRDWKTDLTITIPKRTWAILQERGLSATTLKGQHVRARGVLDEWQGVAVEIMAADMLELVSRDGARP